MIGKRSLVSIKRGWAGVLLASTCVAFGAAASEPLRPSEIEIAQAPRGDGERGRGGRAGEGSQEERARRREQRNRDAPPRRDASPARDASQRTEPSRIVRPSQPVVTPARPAGQNLNRFGNDRRNVPPPNDIRRREGGVDPRFGAPIRRDNRVVEPNRRDNRDNRAIEPNRRDGGVAPRFGAPIRRDNRVVEPNRRDGGVVPRFGAPIRRDDRVVEPNRRNGRFGRPNRQELRRGASERFAQRRSERSRPEVVRRSDTLWVGRRRVRDRNGRIEFANSRRYWVRDRRHSNRFDRRGRSLYWLPPVVAGAAILGAGAYYLSSADASYDDYLTTFDAPPARRLSRRYTLEEIITDPEVRSAVRSVDLNVIRFASGSDEIPEGQIVKLEDLAEAILAVLSRRPDETFLIEGHTDAVGPDDENLELSERRAAAVQEALISEFGIPARSLESVGYGEQYLFINTDEPEVRNRRVVVRAIGVLMSDRR